MKNRTSRLLLGAIFLLTCCVSDASAQVQLYLNNLPTNGVMGGVYTSPYGISIGSQNSPFVELICDDFTTDIGVPSNWTANVTTLTTFNSSTNVGSLKFGAGSSNGALNLPGGYAEDYAVLAVLSAELMLLPDQNSAAGAELSYAIWSVFDQNLYNSLINNGNTGYGNVTTGPGGQQDAVTQIENYLQGAVNLVKASWNTGNGLSVDGHSIESLTVYTPKPLTASQEFLAVSVPEPSYPSVLVLDLFVVLGMILAFRKRIAGTIN